MQDLALRNLAIQSNQANYVLKYIFFLLVHFNSNEHISHLLYIELTISFRIGRKRTVNQRP